MGTYSSTDPIVARQLQNTTNKKLMKNTDIMSGRRGCILIDDVAEHDNVDRDAFIIREDGTEIAVLEGRDYNNDTVDLLTDYNLSGKSLLAGEFIPGKFFLITKIQLASGSVMGY